MRTRRRRGLPSTSSVKSAGVSPVDDVAGVVRDRDIDDDHVGRCLEDRLGGLRLAAAPTASAPAVRRDRSATANRPTSQRVRAPVMSNGYFFFAPGAR